MARQDDQFWESWQGKLAAAVPLLGLAWWMYSSLSALESGNEASVHVWAPVGLLYEHLGFWPAVLLVPCIIVSLVIAALVQFVRDERRFRAEVQSWRERGLDDARR